MKKHWTIKKRKKFQAILEKCSLLLFFTKVFYFTIEHYINYSLYSKNMEPCKMNFRAIKNKDLKQDLKYLKKYYL